jgi:hypothetical protein
MTEQTNTAEKEDKPSRRRSQRSQASPEGGETEAKRPKPDTKGGLVIKMQGDNPIGYLTRDEFVQTLKEQAKALEERFPSDALFKWSHIYSTPCDASGNKLDFDGPKHNRVAPYKSAADELKL